MLLLYTVYIKLFFESTFLQKIQDFTKKTAKRCYFLFLKYAINFPTSITTNETQINPSAIKQSISLEIVFLSHFIPLKLIVFVITNCEIG